MFSSPSERGSSMRRPSIPDVARAVLALVGVCLPAHLIAEQSSSPNERFEVISIKPVSSPASPQMVIRTPPGGGVNATQVTPRFLIRYAFAVDDSLIVGVPDWAGSVRFDVLATGPAGVSADATRAMVRSLLRERFNLQTHAETPERPVYQMMAARPDGRLGGSLRRTDVACAERDARAARPTPPKTLPPRTEPMPCGLRVAFGHISGGRVSMEDLANALAQPTSRPVLDRTALVGAFDLVMNFTPEALRLNTPGPLDPGAPQADERLQAPDPTAPSIFTAIQEQLGLKLEPSRAPIEVLVIDSINRPTPN